jgi:hypothetical protein
MPASKASTGFEGLDDDLRKLFDANSVERRREVKAAIADPRLSEEELFDIVPQAILRLALALREPSSYKALLKQVNEEARQQLEKAKEIIEQHFADIVKHPSLLRRFSLPGEDDDAPTLVNALNFIAEVDHFACWTGAPPAMRPASRLVFWGVDGEILLNSTCDWEDLLFLTQTLSGILICEMKSGKALAEQRLVDLPEKERMVKRLQTLEKNIEKIKQLGRLYGLTFDAQDPDENETGKS